MIAKQAIEKALVQGYGFYVGKKHVIKNLERNIYGQWTYDVNTDDEKGGEDLWWRHGVFDEREAVLNHKFWQSLGKALEWSEDKYAGELGLYDELVPEWQGAALRFYNRILSGGDIEKFWEEILRS